MRGIAKRCQQFFIAMSELLNNFLDTPAPKSKKHRRHNVTRRPSNAFILYCNARRKQVKEGNDDANREITMKRIGEEWTKLSDEERNVRIDLGSVGVV